MQNQRRLLEFILNVNAPACCVYKHIFVQLLVTQKDLCAIAKMSECTYSHQSPVSVWC